VPSIKRVSAQFSFAHRALHTLPAKPRPPSEQRNAKRLEKPTGQAVLLARSTGTTSPQTRRAIDNRLGATITNCGSYEIFGGGTCPTPAPTRVVPYKPVASPYMGTTFTPRSEAPEPINQMHLNQRMVDRIGPEFMTDILRVSNKYGFRLNVSNSGATADLWAEDAMLIMRNGKGDVSFVGSSMPPAIFSAAQGEVEEYFPLQTGLDGMGRAFLDKPVTVSQRSVAVARQSGLDARLMPSAIEGGNLLAVTDKAGDQKLLVGRNSLLINWRAFVATGRLDPAEVDKIYRTRTFDVGLSDVMFEKGKDRSPPVTRAQADRWAAEIELSRRLMAADLNVAPDKLLVIEQYAFHIDMETRAIGQGVIMVPDMNLALKELNDAISEVQTKLRSPTLPASERGALVKELSTLQTLRSRHQVLIDRGEAQPQLDRKVATLEAAGFRVVRVASNFGDIGSTPRRQVSAATYIPDANFSNGVVGVDRSGKTYFITNRSASPTLNALFETRMAAVGVAVEYVNTTNVLTQGGGMDCIEIHSVDRRQRTG
jgi:hypothetical protein